MLNTDDLIVTQESIRDEGKLERMLSFLTVNGGKTWTMEIMQWYCKEHPGEKDPSLIVITEFEDGTRFIHDGHHRVLAALIAGRNFLSDLEYVIWKFKYSQYMEINFDKGFVTPFDPRTEVRLADFGNFKKNAMELYSKDENPA